MACTRWSRGRPRPWSIEHAGKGECAGHAREHAVDAAEQWPGPALGRSGYAHRRPGQRKQGIGGEQNPEQPGEPGHIDPPEGEGADPHREDGGEQKRPDARQGATAVAPAQGLPDVGHQRGHDQQGHGAVQTLGGGEQGKGDAGQAEPHHALHRAGEQEGERNGEHSGGIGHAGGCCAARVRRVQMPREVGSEALIERAVATIDLPVVPMSEVKARR